MRRKMTGISILMITTALATVALADHGHREHHGHRRTKAAPTTAIPAEELARYREECGSCHLAYPPGLLPARSWTRLMGGLDDHFGQNAELDDATRLELTKWLEARAAETGSHPRSAKALRSAGADTPLRISELPYILRKHHELRDEVFTRPEVLSRANCAACHRTAEEWVFDEDSARIPAR